MSDALTRHLCRNVPQSEQENPEQIANSAGGYSFQVSANDQLDRLLILGAEMGTYYISETDLVKENLSNLQTLTNERPEYVIDRTTEISRSGRSYRNNVAIFVLAYVLTFAEDSGKTYARQNVNTIVRTGSHHKLFAKYLKALAPNSGLGTSRNRALANWYESKDFDQLGYQLVKYRQREGWTDRDLFRQCRPKGIDEDLGYWVLGKEYVVPELPEVVQGFLQLQTADNVAAVLSILDRYQSLPWEALPTEFHTTPEVWKKLFYNGAISGQALVRNITRLARISAFDDLGFARDYANKLIDSEMIRRTRLHPIQYLNALVVHREGQVNRTRYGQGLRSLSYRTGSFSFAHSADRTKNWQTSPIIADALDAGYHAAYHHTVPANKRTLVALDVSHSMECAALGLDLSSSQVAAALAVNIARTEPYYHTMAFATNFREFPISKSTSINEAVDTAARMTFGDTDCSRPMVWAAKRRMEFDTFLVITDAETWARAGHPHRALQNYRQKLGIPARLVVLATAANKFTIADPDDIGMLDICGADANAPNIIREFSAGNI